MKHLTAVDWLEQAVRLQLTSDLGPKFADLFEQAKALQAEHLKLAFAAGKAEGMTDGTMTSHDFYEQKFHS